MKTNQVKIVGINPPHADWSLANNMVWLMMESHYNRVGRFADNVEWLEPPYKFNVYQSPEEVLQDAGDADIYMFSSYMWNYDLCDAIASLVKAEKPSAITIVGGPHIGTNDKEFFEHRQKIYDFICEPTKPGEAFIEDFLNEYFGGIFPLPQPSNVSWCLPNTTGKQIDLASQDYSVYEDHINFLTKTATYAEEHNMEPFMILETTRGCPYKCVYCEWGGGTDTKILKKSIDIVKRDIDAIVAAGYKQAYLTDANFGAFEDRDIEIFQYAWERGLYLTDISTVKTKSLERRKRLFDRCFNIVGTEVAVMANADKRTIQGASEYVTTKRASGDPTPILSASVVPTVSIQSVSEEAMRVAMRTDLTLENKIKLSEYIRQRCHEEGFPIPSVELIMAMPGSTIDDFYKEFEIIWNFKAWSSFRHDYIFLPDSELHTKKYLEDYKIELVDVYTDIVDEDGNDNIHGFYKSKRNYFKTISSCYSLSRDDVCEMFFMNIAGNSILRQFYSMFEQYISPAEFTKMGFSIVSQFPEFEKIFAEIEDILNPNTPPRSIKRINNRLRSDVITEFVQHNSPLILSEYMRIIG